MIPKSAQRFSDQVTRQGRRMIPDLVERRFEKVTPQTREA